MNDEKFIERYRDQGLRAPAPQIGEDLLRQLEADCTYINECVIPLVREKGINELVAAFVRLNEQYPQTRLLLVGPYEEKIDPLMPETMRLIEECEAIEAVGSQTDVRPFYERSDVLVFPSYREGFPNVVIEAGAMDLPSIVTDINGAREIIVNHENGLIVPPRDEAALYEAMEWMLNHPEERQRMGQKSRKMVADRYEQGFVRQCLKNYYKEILP